MKLHGIESTKHENYNQVSAQIGKQCLWFRFPADFDVDELDATPFVPMALVPAMMLGEDLFVDQQYTISTKLFNSLESIQQIYHCWNPIFKPIRVVAKPRTLAPHGLGCGSFFSAGVDGTYTLLQHESEIDYLILINGFDFSMDNDSWNAMVDRNKSFAAKFGKKLVPIETNNAIFTKELGLTRTANYGACLAAVSHLLSLNRALVSGTQTYKKIGPDGGHPLLDSLWSSERTSLAHVGLEADRAKKLSLIAENADALANLWVCWRSPNYNCGHCCKCVRTHVALRLNKIDRFSFKQPVKVADLAKESIDGEASLAYYLEFLRLSKQNKDVHITRMINRLIGRYRFKRWFVDMDAYFLADAMRTIFNYLRDAVDKLRGIKRLPMPITLRPRSSDTDMMQSVQAKFADDNFKQKKVNIGSIYIKDGEFNEVFS
jgi:hypothetical protein